MKKSYFDVGRKLTPAEYEELRLWKEANRELAFRAGDVREDGKVFVRYGKQKTNGEYWSSQEVLDKIQKGIDKNAGIVQERITTNQNGRTFLNINRIPTEEEYKSLCEWRKLNPNFTWKIWNQHPDFPSLFFKGYSNTHINGERWQKNKYHEEVCLITEKTYARRIAPLETEQISYFTSNEVLSDSQWEELNIWKKNNPNLRWKRGCPHPLFEKLVFRSYNRRRINGESWMEEEKFEKEKNIQRAPQPYKKLTEKQRNSAMLRAREKRANDQCYKLKGNIASLLWWALNKINVKRGGKRTIEILGCSSQEFKEYIENQFEDWMNWSNQGKFSKTNVGPKQIWQLDHLIPISLAETEEEILLLNHYLNFRPLCGYENQWVKKDIPPPAEEIQKILQSILLSKQNKIISDVQNKFSHT